MNGVQAQALANNQKVVELILSSQAPPRVASLTTRAEADNVDMTKIAVPSGS